MEGTELINAIRSSGLTGRGGANFSTADKWRQMADAIADKKYVIANGAEGEPNCHKDYYLLRRFPKDIVAGILLAMNTVGASEGFLYLKHSYYPKLSASFHRLTRHLPLKIITAPPGYRTGEETVLLEIIEGRRAEPRVKPPYPTQTGLWGYPTLVNNIETLRSVYLISQNRYRKMRFYTLAGHIPHPGVFEAPENVALDDLLFITRNIPDGKTFAQIGGGASGRIITEDDYTKPINCGSVVIHQLNDVSRLLTQWSGFFRRESCGRCLPCREATYRLAIQLNQPHPDHEVINDLLLTLRQTSFCPLGRGVCQPFESLFNSRLSPLTHHKVKS